MALAESISAKLAATPAVVSLGGDRIYPVTPPPGAVRPYVVFQVIASSGSVTHAEALGAVFSLVQFSCFSRRQQEGGTYLEARNLCSAIATALDTVPLDSGESGTLETPLRDSFDEVLDAFRCDADLLF